MEKKINKKALIISLVFALISCALVYNYIRTLGQPEKEVSRVKLIIASRNINIGEEIRSVDLNTVEVAEDSLPAGIINDRKNIEGLFAKEPIIIGEPFRQERLAKIDEMSLAFNIPDGMRALTVYVNEDSIFSNQLRVGDRVDVIGNYEVEALDNKQIKTSKIVLQNIEILSIGSSRVNNNSAAVKAGGEESQMAKTVTLCVNPSDAEKLVFTSNYASYTFILRGRTDEDKINTPGTVIDQLVPHLMIR